MLPHPRHESQFLRLGVHNNLHMLVQAAGILRAADLRATEIDAVVVPECFRPGDVVRARVLSLGDARSFYLSTAADDLGVVFARGEASGEPLVAESEQRMRCPSTGAVEKRKVARQQQQQ